MMMMVFNEVNVYIYDTRALINTKNKSCACADADAGWLVMLILMMLVTTGGMHMQLSADDELTYMCVSMCLRLLCMYILCTGVEARSIPFHSIPHQYPYPYQSKFTTPTKTTTI